MNAMEIDLSKAILRRFKYVTDDPEKQQALYQVVFEKGLTTADLVLILQTLALATLEGA